MAETKKARQRQSETETERGECKNAPLGSSLGYVLQIPGGKPGRAGPAGGGAALWLRSPTVHRHETGAAGDQVCRRQALQNLPLPQVSRHARQFNLKLVT